MCPKESIMGVFYKSPSCKFSYREIERLTGLSIGTVSKYVQDLKDKGLVDVEIRSNANYVSAKKDTAFFRQKRVNNLNMLYETGLVDHLVSELKPETLVLFGSYSKGEDREESDIDIAVIGGRKNEDISSLEGFEKKLQRKISLTSTKADDKNFKVTLANGIVLHGYLVI